jgi:hypothetical protein
MERVYKAHLGFGNSMNALHVRAVLGSQFLNAAIASKNENLIERVVGYIESNPDRDWYGETGKLFAQSAMCVHYSRLNRVREAERAIAHFKKLHPLDERLLPVWGMAAFELSQALAREGRRTEARKLAESVQRYADDDSMKNIIPFLRKFLEDLE